MNIIVMTPVRLLGDGIASCLSNRMDVRSVAVVNDVQGLTDAFDTASADAVLVDVTQGMDRFDVRSICDRWPGVPFVALGLIEQREEVIACGRNGFVGYISRDASIDDLCKGLADAVAGRLTCSPEIANGLLRALSANGPEPAQPEPCLTRRETEVLELIGRGLSNKEIGSELFLSVATVKHHVHGVLEKLRLPKRADAMRRLHDAPWIARLSSIGRRR